MAQADRRRITPADIAKGFDAIGCRLEIFGSRISLPMIHKNRDEGRWQSLYAAIKRLPNGRRDLADYLRAEAA